MKIDLVVSPIGIDVATVRAAVVAAEESGFDAIWTYDHISGAMFGGRPVLDVWTVLALAASCTSRIGLGPLVVNTVARHPAHIAVAIATLQQLSEGRASLGLGAGAGPESEYSRELAMVGLPVLDAASRRQRVIDTIEFLRGVWQGDEPYDAILLPDPPPPIYVAANGPKMATVAGTCADAVNFHDWQPDLPGAIDAARSAAKAAGNDDFAITLEASFEEKWLRPDSDERQELAALGMSRVMVRWNAALGVDAIQRARRWTDTA